jgi:hypothetical protein
MWLVFGILIVNTLFVLKAFGLQTISLAPGSKTVVNVGAPTEVSCQGSPTSLPCVPVAYSKNPEFYQLKIGSVVHPGVYSTLYDASYAIGKLRASGLCQ